jgi:hypothetical protein
LVLLLLSATIWGLVKARGNYTMHEFVSAGLPEDPEHAKRAQRQLLQAGAWSWAAKQWIPVSELARLQAKYGKESLAFAVGERVHNVWLMPGASIRPYIGEENLED